jgi:tetratricopeptide (TPR) repeat protein
LSLRTKCRTKCGTEGQDEVRQKVSGVHKSTEESDMAEKESKASPFPLLILTLLGILLILSILIYIRWGELSQGKLDVSQQQDFASELVDNKLYSQAIAEYDKLLDSGELEVKKQANISYIVGNIYLNYLRDYENAAARFVKARFLNPESELKEKINKNLVICFERMGRSLEAQKQLERSTQLSQTETRKEGGVVVARIGEREIFMADLENEIEKLPPSAQAQFRGKKSKLEFLQQYVGAELLYDTALRRGFDNDKDVVEGAFQIKRQLMINKLLTEEIPQDIQISETEIKLYFDAHKEDFEDKELNEVKAQIESELKRDKQQEAYGKLIQKMMEAEKVKIYDDQF